MTAPDKETEARRWMADDPKLEGMVLLILDRIMPALNHAMGYGKESFPDLDDLTPWMNGAIFGAVATFVKTNNDEADLDGITKLYMCISDVLNTAEGLDLDRYAGDFLERVGAAEVTS